MKFKKFILLGVALLLSTNISAEKWHKVSEDFHLDLDSIILLQNPKRVSQIVRFYIHNDPQGGSYIQGSQTIYCASGEIGLRNASIFDEYGNFVRSFKVPELSDVHPNSFLYGVYQFYCLNKK